MIRRRSVWCFFVEVASGWEGGEVCEGGGFRSSLGCRRKRIGCWLLVLIFRCVCVLFCFVYIISNGRRTDDRERSRPSLTPDSVMLIPRKLCRHSRSPHVLIHRYVRTVKLPLVEPCDIDAYIIVLAICRGGVPEDASGRRIYEGGWLEGFRVVCFAYVFVPLVVFEELAFIIIINKATPRHSRFPIHTIRAITNPRLHTPTPSHHFDHPSLRTAESGRYAAAIKLVRQISSKMVGDPPARERNGMCVGGDSACGALHSQEGVRSDWWWERDWNED
jgi:hypothetical protein